jgi:uncharacterized phage-like protein YoqJ
MTKEQIIKIANEIGLTYSGDDNDGLPEFIGTDKQWEEFNKIDTTEVIEEADFTGACGTNER